MGKYQDLTYESIHENVVYAALLRQNCKNKAPYDTSTRPITGDRPASWKEFSDDLEREWGRSMNHSLLRFLLLICLVALGPHAFPSESGMVNPFFVFEDGLGKQAPERRPPLRRK